VAEGWPVLSYWGVPHSAGRRYEYAPVRIWVKFLLSSLPAMAALGASCLFQLVVANVPSPNPQQPFAVGDNLLGQAVTLGVSWPF